VLGTGKTAGQIIAIARRLRDSGQNVLITRLTVEVATQVSAALPELTWVADARLAYWRAAATTPNNGRGTILVVAAGTADVPVAEEAALTAELLDQPVERVYDVGVAGIHRLFAHHDRLRDASVLIVVAGMEGALPSVVGGLVDKPLIAVPTSIGYGASFGGLAALLAMLNSCAAGVTVVNIDNGFGAGVAAALINRS
jgi:NCAIR mutase (PurE)-related protein